MELLTKGRSLADGKNIGDQNCQYLLILNGTESERNLKDSIYTPYRQTDEKILNMDKLILGLTFSEILAISNANSQVPTFFPSS